MIWYLQYNNFSQKKLFHFLKNILQSNTYGRSVYIVSISKCVSLILVSFCTEDVFCLEKFPCLLGVITWLSAVNSLCWSFFFGSIFASHLFGLRGQCFVVVFFFPLRTFACTNFDLFGFEIVTFLYHIFLFGTQKEKKSFFT